MTRMVQVALAGDATEAEELQALLADAGVDATIEPADGADTLKVMVAEDDLESAIEALGESEDETAVD